MIDLSTFTGCIVSLSTAHIPKHTAEALGMVRDDCAAAPLWGALAYESWRDYGWVIFAGEDYIEELDEHKALATLLQLCRTQGVEWLHLDCDAPTHPDIPTFTWEAPL